jgi:hypothetical protein
MATICVIMFCDLCTFDETWFIREDKEHSIYKLLTLKGLGDSPNSLNCQKVS